MPREVLEVLGVKGEGWDGGKDRNSGGGEERDKDGKRVAWDERLVYYREQEEGLPALGKKSETKVRRIKALGTPVANRVVRPDTPGLVIATGNGTPAPKRRAKIRR